MAYASARPRQVERAEVVFRDAAAAGVEINDHVKNGLARAVGRGRAGELIREVATNEPQHPWKKPAASRNSRDRSAMSSQA